MRKGREHETVEGRIHLGKLDRLRAGVCIHCGADLPCPNQWNEGGPVPRGRHTPVKSEELEELTAELAARWSTPVLLTPEMFGGGKNEGKLMRLSPNVLQDGEAWPVDEEGVCESCSAIRPLSEFDDRGLCGVCQ